MNKKFWCKNGEVFVKDTKGKVKNVVYNPNLKEILLQENLIETIENEIKKLKKKNKRFDERYENNSDYILDVYAPMLALFFGGIIITIVRLLKFGFSGVFSFQYLLSFGGISILYVLLTNKKARKEIIKSTNKYKYKSFVIK